MPFTVYEACDCCGELDPCPCSHCDSVHANQYQVTFGTFAGECAECNALSNQSFVVTHDGSCVWVLEEIAGVSPGITVQWSEGVWELLISSGGALCDGGVIEDEYLSEDFACSTGGTFDFNAGTAYDGCRSTTITVTPVSTIPCIPLMEMRSPPAEEPGLLKMAMNYAKSTMRHIVTGMRAPSSEKHAARIALCMACPSLAHNHCRECGCPVERKAARDSESCPLGKW